jgi:cbb3-type cytochrome oxidase subunit 3
VPQLLARNNIASATQGYVATTYGLLVNQGITLDQQLMLYMTFTWSVKSIFTILWIICYVAIIALQYHAYSRSHYETAIKNADLGIPLMEDFVDDDMFERDIQPWIVNISELSFDERISEGAFGVVFRGKYGHKKMKMQDGDDEFQHEVRMLISSSSKYCFVHGLAWGKNSK